jgi:hypothetical protein
MSGTGQIALLEKRQENNTFTTLVKVANAHQRRYHGPMLFVDW